MFRKALLTSALVATAVVYIAAAERATFVLVSGERKSGEVVFHGDKHENLISGYLNLGNDAGGREFTIPMEQVAVIDFAGGTPTASERAAVPNDSSNHLLVLRNGQTQRGRFVNLISGQTLVWQGTNGGEQSFPIRDVSRVYLNGSVARTAYLNESAPPSSASSSNSSSSGSSGQAQSRALGATQFEIAGNAGWFDTGITVRRGDVLSFQTEGEISIMEDGSKATPDGRTGLRNRAFPVSTGLAGALIGRIGNGRPFLIGSSTEPMPMVAAGRLFLGINDDNLADNGGSFRVTVTKR